MSWKFMVIFYGPEEPPKQKSWARRATRHPQGWRAPPRARPLSCRRLVDPPDLFPTPKIPINIETPRNKPRSGFPSPQALITHKYRGSQQFLRVDYSTQIYWFDTRGAKEYSQVLTVELSIQPHLKDLISVAKFLVAKKYGSNDIGGKSNNSSVVMIVTVATVK